MKLLLVIASFWLSIYAQDHLQEEGTKDNGSENSIPHHHSNFGCDCMEYWSCILSGGAPYSYCGVSEQDVCCMVAENAEPVGILPSSHRASCGRKGRDSEKEGEAEMGEWPWHAAILENPQDLYVCGSTLLDELWVLTAAHCVDDYLAYSTSISDILKVRLGEYDVSTTAEPLRHEEINVTEIHIHPDFNNSTLMHDIALLKLEKPAKRKQNIDVVCMPKQGDFQYQDKNLNCYITGWGRRAETTEHSLVLKEIKVPLWDHANCNDALQTQFGPAYVLPPSSLCAGAEGHDACDGDGGGPLVCERDGHWYQVGIVSFGVGCGRPNVPGVYTKVEAHEEWIESNVLSDKESSRHGH